MNKLKEFFVTVIFFLIIADIVNAQVKHPEWSFDKIIYEVNVRQYTPEGTFNAFSEHLPRLKDLGVGIIWLMPIHPIGEKNRKGNLGSYYSVKDYFAINPEFGSSGDLKNLIKKIHDLDMYVIIDWVANHTAWDNKMTEENPEWFMKDLSGNFIPPVPDWEDVIDLNYDNKDLWKYMIGAMKYWVDEFDIDGYRCDVAGMVPLEFWKEVRNELEKIKPVFLLAEDESQEMHQAFDMTYSWKMLNIINQIPTGKVDIRNLPDYFEEEEKLYPQDAFRMRFTTNHDENTWQGTVFERLGEAAEIMSVFTNIIPGMALIYSGQEAGLNKRLKFFEKDTIEWKEHKLNSIYKKLFHLKKDVIALHNGSRGGRLQYIQPSHSDKVFAFVRESENDMVFALFNFSPEQVSFTIENEKIKGNFIDFLSEETSILSARQDFNLAPWGYKIFIKNSEY